MSGRRDKSDRMIALEIGSRRLVWRVVIFIAAQWFGAWSSRADIWAKASRTERRARKWQGRSRRWHRRSEKFFQTLNGGRA